MEVMLIMLSSKNIEIIIIKSFKMVLVGSLTLYNQI